LRPSTRFIFGSLSSKLSKSFIKIKSSYIAKETINRTKRQSTEWEKRFANDIFNNGFVSKIHKEVIQFNTQKTNNPIKMGRRHE